ncbi:MAG TPA: two-component system response regulator [Cyanobacteria bacterium UBA8553]|nr:two-component system response regulator [Cyanobacteria bacterium UBA8553]HAJ61219.1 two-component system response regulator [Cyanobacteria bacterium UBA8543]
MLTASQYQTGQLHELLGDLQGERASGSVYIKTIVNPHQKPRIRVLVLNHGEIVYGGLVIPRSNQEFARMIGIKFNHTWADSAIKYTAEKLQNPSSFRELLERIVRIRVFKWEEIETVVHAQVVQVLEYAWLHPGQLQLDATVQFDLSHGADGHGLDWSKLMQDVNNRQQEWATLAPVVPSMDAVPRLSINALSAVTDTKVQQHLRQWVDGMRSLIDIAEQTNQDPLELARSYMAWAISGWVTLGGDTPTSKVVPATNKQLPIVLSVDDSLVVQTMIKRALSDRYQVLLASNAVDALKMISTNPVALLLLDVSMPEIDGLEFCRTVRSIGKFKNLPIIMITARDKFSDKLKGQIAGATYYLTKPVEPQQLLEIVNLYA